ncbi:trigger factor [[Clostridium] polysaccharolyticum]|uniref:peptidylprolyl isomerase n=1 Tax=[Clostridium] polysaccharolyticum TaxID=29364 RepID=A0A1I0BTS5_9FIRM|nr:trigger factor [[Clostridium] polysaccharolyticum]SET10172.1 trigger factor [[Clostridium] polysaccharolyticum]
MKKKLLCLLTCMSVILVACSGTRENVKKETKTESKTTDLVKYAKCVTLGEYKGMELTKETGQVEDKDMQDRINQILQEHATVNQIKEGTVKDGDTVNIDYVGKVDGVPFDNGSAKGQSLTIGSHSYIDGFESGLIGAKVGTTVTINVTFPEDYGADELKGKDATFDVTINYISGEKKVPKWTDEFVRSITEYDTTKEYEAQIRVELEQRLKDVEERSLQADILTKLVETSEFKELPKDLVQARSDSMINYYKDYAKQNNIKFEDLITNTFKVTEEQFNQQVKETSENSVKQTVVAYAVAVKENLIPTGDEKAKKELEIAKQYGAKSVEEFAKTYGDDYALQLVIRDAVVKFVEDNANITEKKVTSGTKQNQ